MTKHRAEAAARAAKRYPVTDHRDVKSVGSHCGMDCADKSVLSVDEDSESYSGSGGGSGTPGTFGPSVD